MAVSSKLATFWSYASTGAITLCALALTYRAFNQDAPTPPTASLTVVDNWVDYTKTGERVGSKSAKSVVVVFSDYQCPYCKLMHERLDDVLSRRPNDVAVVYRHWPLSNIHPHAFAAAVTASCAAKQHRFAEANRALYSLADSLSLISQNEVAKRVGVKDLEAFDSCVQDSTVFESIRQDMNAAGSLGATGTPLLLVNGRVVKGAIRSLVLDSLLDQPPADVR